MKSIYVILVSLIALSCSDKKQHNDIIITDVINTEKQTELTSAAIYEKDYNEISKVALQFINDYVSNCNKMKDQVGIVEWTHASPYASDQFKTKLTSIIEVAEKQNPDYGLGFDPFFDAQDYPDLGFEIKEIDTSSGYLTVSGKENWTSFEVIMSVKKIDSRWLVDGCGVVNIPKNKQAFR